MNADLHDRLVILAFMFTPVILTAILTVVSTRFDMWRLRRKGVINTRKEQDQKHVNWITLK